MQIEAKYFGVLNERITLANYMVLPTVLQQTLETYTEEGAPILARQLRERGNISRDVQSIIQEGSRTSVEASFMYLYKKLAVRLLDTGMYLRGLSFDRFILYTDMAAGVLLTGLTYAHPGDVFDKPTSSESYGPGVKPMTDEQDVNYRLVRTMNGIITAEFLKEDPRGYSLVEEAAKNVRKEVTRLTPEKASTKEFIPEYLAAGTRLAVEYYKGVYPIAEGLYRFNSRKINQKKK